MRAFQTWHYDAASFTCYFQRKFVDVLPSSDWDSWSIWPPKFIWLDGFSSQNADNHRLMQIISGLQNFDRSSVASVVTAADKVLTMHLSLNVYYFVLKCIAVLLLYFKKNIFCSYRLLWDRIMWKMRFTSLIPCKDNMKKHWNSKAIVNLLMLSCLLVSSRAMNNVRSCRWWFFLTKKSNYTGGHCTGFNVPDRALIILHPEC